MPHTTNDCYEFGPYRLNSEERVLTRAGETVGLTPKGFEILMMLVRNPGRVMEKDHILREVWADTFVEDNNLTQNIFILRRALGDERSGPKYIETVPGRGYRFIANVKVCNGDGATGEVDVSAATNGDSSSPQIIVAVLPFMNATGDASLEYLAEGVTDNIINHLSRVSQLRVMSRSAVFRRKKEEFDPQLLARELGANAVLVGTISSRPAGIAIGVELVDVATGWQLWGESFDSTSKDLLDIHDVITRQLLVNLQLKLTGEEEKRVTARYTENAEAYQAYLEGRYHWSRYTRQGMEKAIGHFREAIELDPNYALAYAAIVDCYLRLATNYLPPENDIPGVGQIRDRTAMNVKQEAEHRIRLRFQWDWKVVERERRRANELKTDYPSPYQWYVAYRLSEQLYNQTSAKNSSLPKHVRIGTERPQSQSQMGGVLLTPTEEVQILCSVARDQIAIGNYQAASLILDRWISRGQWPRLDLLNPASAADLLFTAGNLFGWVAGSRQLLHGQKRAEAFLNAAAALFEHLSINSCAAEAQIELARCYYREGLLDFARDTVSIALSNLPKDQLELKTFALVILGVIERDSGCLKESLVTLREAANIESTNGLVTNRCYLDLATTLKELALSERDEAYLAEAKFGFWRALFESEALGHHRNVGSVENNIGFLFLNLGLYDESEQHLLRAQKIFVTLADSVRNAQVNDTLARLYIQTKQLDLARQVINEAVRNLEMTDSDAILAEALTTKGIVESRQNLYADAKRSFEAGHKIAQRCGDNRGAANALVTLLKEIGSTLASNEALTLASQARELLSRIPKSAVTAIAQQLVDGILSKEKPSC